jgi:hypothetical protein
LEFADSLILACSVYIRIGIKNQDMYAFSTHTIAMALIDEIQSCERSAILIRDYNRLDDFEHQDIATHRSNKPWHAAEAGVKKFGSLPLYYAEAAKNGGMVTHTGHMTMIVINPDENKEKAQALSEKVTDKYEKYHAEFDTTTFLAEELEDIEPPFHQSQLEKLSGGTIHENYSREPVYVQHRPNDFI